MTKQLHIARGLKLPVESITQTFAILAQRRKGKTYTASVIAEEMVAAGLSFVALDPTGAWWGLRASADGKREGLPVTILGGDHGDVPLERTAGALIADLVVDEPGWYVLDLSHFDSKAAERQFATDFAERFYRRKAHSPDPVHLFVDEADLFAPQKPPKGDQRMLGAFEALVRRGGLRGIGTTLITQRPAVLNKNVLEQVDDLIVLRVVGPNDQAAIKRYVQAHGSEEELRELMDSLASLKLGEAWVWEPGAEPALFERVQIRERRTFNSSATPKAGKRRVLPRKMADVDLEALSERMAATVERAKRENPKELQRQVNEKNREIARLKRDLEQRPTEPVEVEKPIEVPVLANGAVEKLEDTIKAMVGVGTAIVQAGEGVRADLQRVADYQPPSPRRQQPPARPSQRSQERAVEGDEVKLARAERKILEALAQFPQGRTKVQIALLAGYSAKSGGFNNAIGKLRTAGLISPAGEDPITATEEGLAEVPIVPVAPTGEELRDYWFDKLGRSNAQGRILSVLCDAYPDSLTKDEIAERADYSANSGGFNNALGKLRTLELAVGYGQVQASDDLFEGVAV